MSDTLATLTEAVRHMAAALGEHPYALIGGLAVGVRARPRMTMDADVLVAVPRIALPGVLEHLVGEGFDLDLQRCLVQLRDDCLTQIQYRGVRVDIMGAPIPAYQEVIRLAQWEDFHGVRVRVASVEGLVFLKMLAFRDQDKADVRPLIGANRGKLDFDIIRRLYSQVGEIGDERWQFFERVVRELDEEAARRSS